MNSKGIVRPLVALLIKKEEEASSQKSLRSSLDPEGDFFKEIKGNFFAATREDQADLAV